MEKLTHSMKKNREDMKKHFVAFISIFMFTILSFVIISLDIFTPYVHTFLFVFATLQMLFQFYYFIHMKDKGHKEAAGVMFGGLWVVFLIALSFTFIIWW